MKRKTRLIGVFLFSHNLHAYSGLMDRIDRKIVNNPILVIFYYLTHYYTMNIILWIIFGGLAGWVASLLMGTDARQGVFLNIVVGIIGAVVGGFIMNAIGTSGVSGFNLYSFAVAIIGSVVLLGILRAFRRV